MIAGGLDVISCGANVPFADEEIFFGSIGEFADERVSVLPDFIANCGMARVFAYLMNPNIEMTDTAIFEDTSATILKALKKHTKLIHQRQTFQKLPLKSHLTNSFNQWTFKKFYINNF